ncbi:hypothetical protein [Pseudoduganella violaceinigra]|uniref:hypothetical protein n=1 Tax=Pseudoduganella violaceinigra TaxID=246602 RepID=UPI00048927B9|nr:hypothetical protein [Pseudoduganella violaceinigra]
MSKLGVFRRYFSSLLAVMTSPTFRVKIATAGIKVNAYVGIKAGVVFFSSFSLSFFIGQYGFFAFFSQDGPKFFAREN